MQLVVCFKVGPEGFEPSPIWLRARHAANNTSDPQFHFDFVFKVGPEGFEPPPSTLKECCATVDTTTP